MSATKRGLATLAQDLVTAQSAEQSRAAYDSLLDAIYALPIRLGADA